MVPSMLSIRTTKHIYKSSSKLMRETIANIKSRQHLLRNQNDLPLFKVPAPAKLMLLPKTAFRKLSMSVAMMISIWMTNCRKIWKTRLLNPTKLEPAPRASSQQQQQTPWARALQAPAQQCDGAASGGGRSVKRTAHNQDDAEEQEEEEQATKLGVAETVHTAQEWTTDACMSKKTMNTIMAERFDACFKFSTLTATHSKETFFNCFNCQRMSTCALWL